MKRKKEDNYTSSLIFCCEICTRFEYFNSLAAVLKGCAMVICSHCIDYCDGLN